jgi:hypothetical protein
MRPWIKYSLFVVVGLMLGIVIQRYGLIGNYLKPLFKRAQHAAQGGNAGFQKLSITLKEKDWYTILAYTDSATAKGMIDDKYKTEFFAKATYADSKDQECAVRLKGDWSDHAMRDKPSLRVTMGDSTSIMGMQRFSLQHPRTRNYVYEWIYTQAMLEEDILAPRYTFVELEVNGKSYGTYAFEEHFDKILVENLHRREGPIVKFDESALWQERERHPNMKGDPTGLQTSATAPIIAFRDGKILKDSMLTGEFLAARTLLEGFRDGKYSADKVFDTTRMATFFAVCELLGARHGSGRWHNLRFYYNPITAKLEPIAYDGDGGKEITDVFGIGSHPKDLDLFYQRLFDDSLFYRCYLHQLERVSKSSYLDKFLAKKKPELDKLQKALAIEFTDAEYSDKPFYQNMRTICLAIHPDKCVNSYLKKKSKDKVTIEWATIQPLAIEVTGLQIGNRVLKPTAKPIAKGNLPGYPATYQTTEFNLPAGYVKDKKPKYKLLYKTAMGQEGKDKVFGFERLNEDAVFCNPAKGLSIIKRLPSSDEPNVLWRDLAPNKYHGFWIMERPLHLKFSYGWHNATYPDGFLVISDSTSTITDYKFANVKGRGIDAKGRNITGSFTFYGGKVIIKDCLFENITSEDVLNLIRCDFVLENCTFRNCTSDAFDADFCTGKIINCKVENCKNDGFDISGSNVEFVNCTVTNAGDKGISVGEGSTATITGFTVTDATSGIGIKDLSYAKISNSTLVNCGTGLNLYRKKPEFGYAKADASGIKFVNCTQQSATDKGSVVNISK